MNQSAARHYPSHRLVSSVLKLPSFEKLQYFSPLSSPCKTSFIQVNSISNRAIFSSFCMLAFLICLIIVSNFTFSISHFLKKRSEEHTSELQSRGHLVCRLLLEKK